MGEGLIAAALSMLGALLGQARLQSRPDRAAKRVEATRDLIVSLEAVPGAEGARGRLTRLLDEQVDYLERVERRQMERRYDPSQLVVAALLGLPLSYGAYLLWGLDSWYWRLAAVVVAMIVVMFAWVGIAGFFKTARTHAEDYPTPPAEVETAGASSHGRS